MDDDTLLKQPAPTGLKPTLVRAVQLNSSKTLAKVTAARALVKRLADSDQTDAKWLAAALARCDADQVATVMLSQRKALQGSRAADRAARRCFAEGVRLPDAAAAAIKLWDKPKASRYHWRDLMDQLADPLLEALGRQPALVDALLEDFELSMMLVSEEAGSYDTEYIKACYRLEMCSRWLALGGQRRAAVAMAGVLRDSRSDAKACACVWYRNARDAAVNAVGALGVPELVPSLVLEVLSIHHEAQDIRGGVLGLRAAREPAAVLPVLHWLSLDKVHRGAAMQVLLKLEGPERLDLMAALAPKAGKFKQRFEQVLQKAGHVPGPEVERWSGEPKRPDPEVWADREQLGSG